jgi:hypothetical protein
VDDAVDVYQLLPVGVGYDDLSNEDLATHEETAQFMMAGEWDKAQKLLAYVLRPTSASSSSPPVKSQLFFRVIYILRSSSP